MITNATRLRVMNIMISRISPAGDCGDDQVILGAELNVLERRRGAGPGRCRSRPVGVPLSACRTDFSIRQYAKCLRAWRVAFVVMMNRTAWPSREER